MNNTTRVLLVAAIAVGLAACTKKTVPDQPQPPQPQPPQTATVDDGKYGPEDLDTDACLKQRTVYFDFDQDAVKGEFQAILACHAKYLQDRPESRITLEGNADERGSREYNLGLGERRGNAVSGALQAAGGSAGQLTVVSYGEERPVDTASTEEAWAKNRRVEIVYTAR
jgi:peptidoglycan-associated lipoprotein